MPSKPACNGVWSRKVENGHYENHDQVRQHSNIVRRVNFKPGGHKNKRAYMGDAEKYMLDDISDMVVNVGGNQMTRRRGTSRGTGDHPYPHASGFSAPSKRINAPSRGTGDRPYLPASRFSAPRKFIPGTIPSYKILIPNGASHEKDDILKAITNRLTPEVFVPHYYNIKGNSVVFFVDDVNIAEKLFHADKNITMSDGFRLTIIVRNAYPDVNIDEKLKERMKLVMAKRYDASKKALDLTKFHADPDLADVFCALCRQSVMLAAIDIMADNIPDLEALNLSDNNLNKLNHMRNLYPKLKKLRILYMGDNKITHIKSLYPLQRLPLIELYLKGNPLACILNDEDIYISDVRKKFPKLIKLDGVELPPAITFDVSEDVALPQPQPMFLADVAGANLVREFLVQYFTIYDSQSREPLLQAYHEHATMSMTANYLSDDIGNGSNSRLNAYIPKSRNLFRVSYRESRQKHLKTGVIKVVSFLLELPKTKHDMMGFAVDLSVFTPSMIVLTVNGVFKEADHPCDSYLTRSFHRTFVIAPKTGGGLCIMNDMLFISNTTRDQAERSFVVPTPVPKPTLTAVLTSAELEQHAMLLDMLRQETHMNEHWCKICLRESGWDPQRALSAFNKLHSEGKIPPEAFIKT